MRRVPRPTAPPSLVAAAIVAPPSTSNDECKNGGWQQFNSPYFKNQGNSIQFANTGK